MADQAPAIVPEDLFTKAGTADETQRALTMAYSRLQIATAARNDVTVLDEGYIDVEQIDSLLVAHVNGQEGLPDQTVVVEYLHGGQRMHIPAMLAMTYDTQLAGWATPNNTLIDRYHKLTTRSYAQIKALCVVGRPLAEARAAVDALELPPRPATGYVQFLPWLTNDYYTDDNGQQIDQNETIIVFSYISVALQMNADVRDFGMLLRDDMVKTDVAWKDADKTIEIYVKLRVYTMQNIAALNYARVNNYPLAAWVRAYGIGVGIMPSRTSKTVVEYIFTTRLPSEEHKRQVGKWHRDYTRNAAEICCNILAMFGLFHLNKDHTHRANDASMQRIQRSYIGAIRTSTVDSINESMQAHAEEVARTASHPFGLAQTYWLALAMGHLQKLAAPLALRVNTCPPPVQRLMMVNAMLKEWAGIPAGQMLNKAFAEEFATVVQEVDIVRASPPAYSGLCRLYGYDKQSQMSQNAINAVSALIPPIYGYVMLTHVSPTQERSGPALALSWNNITREHNAVLDGWRNLWSRYFEGMETMPMGEFAMSTKVAQLEYQRALEAAKERRED